MLGDDKTLCDKGGVHHAELVRSRRDAACLPGGGWWAEGRGEAHVRQLERAD